MLEVEDIEDASGTVDDMEATDYSQSLVQKEWSEGRGDKHTRVTVLGAGGARLWRLPRTGEERITALFVPGITQSAEQTLQYKYKYWITDYCTRVTYCRVVDIDGIQ